MPRRGGAADLDALARELTSVRFDLDDFEVAIRDGRRFVRRLQAVEVGRAEDEASITVPGVGGRYRAGLAHTGLLDSVELRQIPAVIPAAGQVEIEVHAAGLNFKDVVNGMGVLPSRAVRGGLAGDELGLEVAGRVVATGADVTDFQPGDRVMARVAHGFAGRVIADRHCVTPLPECIGMVEGAAIPVVPHRLLRAAPPRTARRGRDGVAVGRAP